MPCTGQASIDFPGRCDPASCRHSRQRTNHQITENTSMNSIRTTGLAILRKVLGESYFAKRSDSANAFNADIRALTEEYCFGAVWGRPGLDARTRSMLV